MSASIPNLFVGRLEDKVAELPPSRFPLPEPISVVPFPDRFSHRLGILTVLLCFEVLAATLWLDAASLRRSTGLSAVVYRFGPWTLRAAVASAAFFLAFSYLVAGSKIRLVLRAAVNRAISWRLFAGHLLVGVCFVVLSSSLFGNPPPGSPSLVAASWFSAWVVCVGLAALSFLPVDSWFGLFRASGTTWAYALGAGMLTSFLGSLWWSLWLPASRLTFSVVETLLHVVVPKVITDPVTRTIGTPEFEVMIDPACSGLEGVGLVLVFGVVWLWLFRREFRFPRALLLLPVGAVVIWVLNSVRITALILIGHAGAPRIAAGGFHSQAGWLTFNAVAIGLAIGARHIPWLTRRETIESRVQNAEQNPTAAYLVPFLAILAAAMISRAFAGDFEWLYPLRFFAAAATLWIFRSKYRGFRWRFGWLSPAIGGLVFVLWLTLDHLFPPKTGNPIGSILQSAPVWLAGSWLVLRTLAHVVTVPIAEELAFRGFLIRRLISTDFEALDWRRFTWLSLAISSVAFGIMHGDRWLAGTVAGALYAGALLWRGRIGDAVVAHATTNGLLAAWVLINGSWDLW